jgi:hypothetical protein
VSAVDLLAAELAERLLPKLTAGIAACLSSRATTEPGPAGPMLMSETRYAEKYGVSARSLQHWRRVGRVTPAFVRLGRRILYVDAVPGK